MKKILTVILVLGLMASFVACNNTTTQSGDKLEQSGNKVEQGNEQEKAQGTVLSMEGNVTTGYTWHVTDYDDTIIKVEKLEVEELTDENSGLSGEDLVGTPSLFKFKITGLKAGTTNLIFDYFRSFEGVTSSVDIKQYVVTVDELLNVVATEKTDVESELPVEDDYTASAEMEAIVNDLISKSGVQFAMPATTKILVENAPTFVGLSEDQFTTYVVDSVVYEPMISPATSSMCIVKLSEDADVATLKKNILDNCNPAKWICTGAEKCLVIESGRYVMLVMSTPDNCTALKDAFVQHFGAENVGKELTKDGLVNEMPSDM